MTNDDKPKPSDENKNEKIMKVEQLYRMADRKYGSFAETGNEEGSHGQGSSGKNPAPETTDSHAESEVRPTWILSVLDDLANFAKYRGMVELQQYLQNVRGDLAEIIERIDYRED